MAFELDAQIEDVTTRNIGNVEALLARRMEDAKKVEELQAILDKSRKAHETAMKRVLDEKLNLVEQYVDTTIKSKPAPTEYNANRVAELRKLVAYGSDETLELRCKKMDALWELQMYLQKFPLVDRVAETIRKWTKCPNVVVTGDDPFNRRLSVNGSTVMTTYNSSREYYDYNSAPPRKNSMANISVGYDHYRVDIVNFWEIYLGMHNFDLKYILGVSECGRWGDSCPASKEYPHILSRICTNSGRVDRKHQLFKSMADESYAPIVLLSALDRLTVNQCLDAAECMDNECQNTIRHNLGWCIQKIFQDDTAQTDFRFSFDSEARAFKWELRTNTEGVLKFDPDTCEIVQPKIAWKYVPVGDVIIRDLHDYVAARVPWMTGYGTVKVLVQCKDGIDLIDEWNKRGKEMLASWYESSFNVVSVEKTNTDGMYSMDVALRVPSKKAFQGAGKPLDGKYILVCDTPSWYSKPVIH